MAYVASLQNVQKIKGYEDDEELAEILKFNVNECKAIGVALKALERQIKSEETIGSNDGIKVYRMNDYEWWASRWDAETTNNWYNKNIEENDLGDVRECDLDKDGMYWFDDENIPSRDEEKEKCWITFREALKRCGGDRDIPFCIACKE